MLTTWLGIALFHPAAHAEGVEAGADVTATARVGTDGCLSDPAQCQWINFRDAAVVSPWISAQPNKQIQARADVDLRLHGLESQESTENHPVCRRPVSAPHGKTEDPEADP